MIQRQNENQTKKPTTTRVGFLLIEGFSMLCIAAMVNPLRSANRELGYKAYIWDFVTCSDKPVSASDGMEARPTLPCSTNEKFDYFFVCAGMECNPDYRAALNSAMKRIAWNSKIFGSLCTGAYMLARAGFLDGYRFTLHWENLPAFEEEFPDLDVSSNLYVMDRDRWSGSGGLSSMDMALNIIASDHGHAVAHAVGNQYQIDRVRSADIGQRPYSLDELETLPASLQRAISVMMVNMESPLSIPEVASAAGKTVRSLERLSQRHLARSPARFYRKLRLERARQLLWHTNLSILEIALMTGFPSPSHLSRLYQQEFGLKPSAERSGPKMAR
ncbi:MAG: GlxA family transcriptional regulator [Rhodobacteraceae bacterium]|nr:GlxA family transcriptional regulator [Paracoccaceae bacterium]